VAADGQEHVEVVTACHEDFAAATGPPLRKLLFAPTKWRARRKSRNGVFRARERRVDARKQVLGVVFTFFWSCSNHGTVYLFPVWSAVAVARQHAAVDTVDYLQRVESW
jgi:hypothetical protein